MGYPTCYLHFRGIHTRNMVFASTDESLLYRGSALWIFLLVTSSHYYPGGRIQNVFPVAVHVHAL